MSKYPLHDELKARAGERATAQAFLDWLESRGWEICKLVEPTRRDPYYEPTYWSKEALIAGFLEIDLQAFQAEKEAMVDEMREANEPQA